MPATGDLNAGKTVALTLAFSGAVTVAGGTPSTTEPLPTPAARAPTPSPSTTPWLPDRTLPPSQPRPSTCQSGVTIKDGAGNAADLSLTGLIQHGPQINTTAPAAPVISIHTAAGNVTLKGTAEPNSTIRASDNSTRLGAATTSGSGAWSFTTGALASGSHSFTGKAADSASNVSPLLPA